jgi:hypothetical protein
LRIAPLQEAKVAYGDIMTPSKTTSFSKVQADRQARAERRRGQDGGAVAEPKFVYGNTLAHKVSGEQRASKKKPARGDDADWLG